MPNHIHLILRPKGKVALEKILKKFHSYTAHEILKVLREDKHAKALILFNQVAVSDYQDRSHLIWQDCLVKHIVNKGVLEKILEYIHSNPNNKKWKLTEDRTDFKYSSAAFYDKGQKTIIAVDDARDWF